MTKRLLEPVLEGGVRHPNFSNGVVLTAEALAAAQRAGRDLHRHLGRALGPGIVHGLEVRLTRPGSVGVLPQITIGGGLAINALGDTLALAAEEVVLEPAQPAAPAAPAAGLFGDCEALAPADDSARGTFILALGPASGFDGRILRLDLVAETPSPGCAHRYAVEGVRFKLVPLPLPPDVAADASRLRNRIAHHLFGTVALAARPHDPFGVPDPHGALALLMKTAGSGLGPCDVPLALVSWPSATIAFLDSWAVRRRPQGSATAALWPQHLPRRRAEAEAVLFQFEDELAALVAAGAAPATVAAQRFRHLPAAAYLPLGPGRFEAEVFFRGLDTEEVALDEAHVRQVVESGFAVDVIDLDDPPRIALLRPPGSDAGYLVFARLAVGATQPAPEQEQEFSTEEPGRGAIEVVVTAAQAANGRGTPVRKRSKARGIEVTAEDAAGRVRRATPIEVTRDFGELMEVGEAPALRFALDDLDPGPWTVRVSAPGFQPASRRVEVTGRRERVAIELQPAREGGKAGRPGKRPGKADFGWYSPHWFERAVVVPEIRYPWPPRDIEPFDPVRDPPEEVLAWAADWAAELGRLAPEAAFDPAAAAIVVNPQHLPGEVATGPYAYLTFGKGGGYVPLVLVPTDAALPREVAVAAGGIADIDMAAAAALSASGIADLETLSAAWTGLVGETLGVSAAAAGALIGDARGRVAHLRGAGELDSFKGMSAPLKTALGNEGVTGAVGLANAEPQKLGARLRELGVEVTDAFATRLVEEARASTPPEAWSLRAESLGLAEAEVSALAAIGITSQGGLKAAAGDGGAQIVATVTGRDAGAVRTLVGAIDLEASATRLATERIAAAPVLAASPEIKAADAQRLAGSGFATLGQLALADVEAVAGALGGDRPFAERLVSGAQGRLGGI